MSHGCERVRHPQSRPCRGMQQAGNSTLYLSHPKASSSLSSSKLSLSLKADLARGTRSWGAPRRFQALLPSSLSRLGGGSAARDRHTCSAIDDSFPTRPRSTSGATGRPSYKPSWIPGGNPRFQEADVEPAAEIEPRLSRDCERQDVNCL